MLNRYATMDLYCYSNKVIIIIINFILLSEVGRIL